MKEELILLRKEIELLRQEVELLRMSQQITHYDYPPQPNIWIEPYRPYQEPFTYETNPSTSNDWNVTCDQNGIS